MPVNTYIYDGESPRDYPYPPLRRHFAPGDEVELTELEVPRDGRFFLKGPAGERLDLPPLPDPQEPAPADTAGVPAAASPPTSPEPEPPTATAAAAPAAKPKASKTKE